MKRLFVMFLLGVNAHAALHTETVEYKHGDVVLKGYLAYDDAATGKRPGVLVVHEWWGLNDYAKRRAEQLAQLGYVGFAVDMYGDGFATKSPEEAGKHAGALKDNRGLLRARIRTGLDELRRHAPVDPQRVAAIGYCFGGTTVLELARSGADVAGVVSFHGGLDSPTPADGKNIKCRLLVCHGADDPYVPPADIAAFQNELRHAGVDWQMIFYGGAVHSFSNPASGNDPGKGVAYNEGADRRSWAAMKQFLAEIFH